MKRLSSLLFSILLLSTCINKSSQNNVIEKNPFYEKALAYRDSGNIDSSFAYFNKAKDIFLLRKDSLSAGKCLVNMGIFATNNGDYFGGQEISLSAISCFKEAEKNQIAYICSNFNNLGLASYHLKDYENALKFYDEVIKFVDNPLSKFICLNNVAKVYEELGQYTKAIKIYNDILNGTVNNPQLYARALANVSFAKWLQNPNYNPVSELLKSMRIRERENDQEGLNYCYARLADFYSKKNQSLAKVYALKMYQVAKGNYSADDQLEALYKLVKLSPSKESKNYFVIYEKLNDSLQTARTSAKNQFALIRYDSEKSKADNLVLQKDNTEKKYQIIKQKTLLISGLSLACFVIIVSIVLYKRRKQRLELASRNTIRESQLRTSKKVHDVVANGLYRVMAQIENAENLDREHVLDKLEEMYEKSRDISYEIPKLTQPSFSEKIAGMINSFASANIEIELTGNTKTLWRNTNETTKHEIEYILQELMINMDKHSKANHVVVKFEKKAKQIHIYYADNGIGIPKQTIFKNGLSSTGNRIKNIFGTITFDQQNEKGLEIHISFPVS
ncbi:tetratricopeptide repeat protein [Pedobacter sp. Du54]|uniref:tetratricopeptide repeat-containing sensor histidine kinase n=1 Tax=Pedobacter anseongensis TaxID=3133439 RepID=UPI00309845F5